MAFLLWTAHWIGFYELQCSMPPCKERTSAPQENQMLAYNYYVAVNNNTPAGAALTGANCDPGNWLVAAGAARLLRPCTVITTCFVHASYRGVLMRR